jgi:hypothetical protein
MISHANTKSCVNNKRGARQRWSPQPTTSIDILTIVLIDPELRIVLGSVEMQSIALHHVLFVPNSLSCHVDQRWARDMFL